VSTLELPALYVDSLALVASTPRLVLVNRDPSPGESGVPVDATLAIELVDTGPDGVHRASARVWVDGVLAFEGGAPAELPPAFAGPLAGVTQTADTLRVVLHPGVPLASLVTVSVRVLAHTVGGAASLDEVYSFVVEDRTAPRVVGAQALSQREVRIAFDEPVVIPNGARFLFTPLGAPAVPVSVVATMVDGSTGSDSTVHGLSKSGIRGGGEGCAACARRGIPNQERLLKRRPRDRFAAKKMIMVSVFPWALAEV
jgi:hypothetical protein